MTIMNTRLGESVMLLLGGNASRKKGGMRDRGIVVILILIASTPIVRMSARRRLVSHLKKIHTQVGFISLEFLARYDDDYEMPAPVAVDTSMTGDEAYQRRLALSRSHNVPSRTPPVVAETGEEAYLRRAALSQQPVIEVQREPSPPALAYNPFAPPTNIPPPPPAPTGAEYEARLKQSREAAAAIVAKLAATASLGDTDPTPLDNNGALTESSEM